MKKLLALLIITSSYFSFGQELKFTINGLADTTVFLAKYFGQKLYYADTVKSVKGVVKYDGKKHPEGIYAVVMPGSKYFEFVHQNEVVDMRIGDVNDLINSVKVIKSKNNTIFYDYIQYMSNSRKRSEALSKQIEGAQSEEDKEKYKKDMEDLNAEVSKYQKDLVKNNSGMFISKMIGMTLEIDLPEPPRNEKGEITDSNYVYNYYINHYWDNVDLKDESITRTPVFHNKLDKFFSKQALLQIPDSIIKHGDILISKTDPTGPVFQYIVHHITNKYERSEIMGMDKIFVHMADKYYCPAKSTKAFWMSEENLKKVCERADKLRPTIIGSYAPRLILTDTTEKNWIDFYKIDAEYKVLYFWDPNCGHCKKTTPKMQTLYEKKFKEKGVEFIAIAKATGSDFEDWKKFIVKNNLTFINIGLTKNIYNQAQEDARTIVPKHTTLESLNYSTTYDIYSTPRIFLLDKDNKIIYKQLSISQLEEILDFLLGQRDAEKLFPKEVDGNDEQH